MFDVGVVILYISFKDFNWTFEKLLQIMLKDALQIVIALFFIGLVIYAINISLSKKKIVCSLKNIIDLRNANNCYSFELQFVYQNKNFYYNIKENNHHYIVGNNYTVLIRNYEILSILSETAAKVDKKNNYWHSTYMPDGSYNQFNLLIVFYIFAVAFGLCSIVILINIFINNVAGKELISNIISLIICSIIFVFNVFCIYNDYKKKKESDNEK